jgi:hypothetical protein
MRSFAIVGHPRRDHPGNRRIASVMRRRIYIPLTFAPV